MKTIYISGKITGCPDLNRHKFRYHEVLFRAHHFAMVNVINPHNIPDNHDKSWASYMKNCLIMLCASDEVAALDDWMESPGAIFEVLTALLLRIPVLDAHELAMERRVQIKPSKLTILYLFIKVLVKRF